MDGVGEFGGYARVSGGVVYIYGQAQGRYQTVRVDRDEECSHLSCELTPWAPAPGERVTESNNDNCITGVALEVNENTTLIMWTGFSEPQTWRNAKLEPAWD
jgi:hypothetical protein